MFRGLPKAIRDSIVFWAPLRRDLLFKGTGSATFSRASVGRYLGQGDGLEKQAAIDVARYETDGILLEPARTNKAFGTLTDAAWVKTSLTVTPSGTYGPDGVLGAYLLTAMAANGQMIQDLGVLASQGWLHSWWLKRKSGTGAIKMTLNGGATWATVVVGSSWSRLWHTQTLIDPDIGLQIATSGDEVWAWQPQCEWPIVATWETKPSSTIVTGIAEATRSRDILTFPGANFTNYEGTIVLVVTYRDILAAAGGDPILMSIADGTSNNRINIQAISGLYPYIAVVKDGVWQVAIQASGDDFAAGVPKVLAATYRENEFILYSSGIARGQDLAGSPPIGLTVIRVGAYSDANYESLADIRDVILFNRALTAAEIATLSSRLAGLPPGPIAFLSGTSLWAPGEALVFPHVRTFQRDQVEGKTDSGKFYVYDKGGERRVFDLAMVLAQADKDELDTFIRSTSVYAKNTFTYYDEDGLNHTVRLIGADLQGRETSPGKVEIGLSLREEL